MHELDTKGYVMDMHVDTMTNFRKFYVFELLLLFYSFYIPIVDETNEDCRELFVLNMRNFLKGLHFDSLITSSLKQVRN